MISHLLCGQIRLEAYHPPPGNRMTMQGSGSPSTSGNVNLTADHGSANSAKLATALSGAASALADWAASSGSDSSPSTTRRRCCPAAQSAQPSEVTTALPRGLKLTRHCLG